MGPCRTGRHHRVVRPPKAIADAHLTRNQVDQGARNKERRDPPRTLFRHHQRRVGDRIQTTDPRADQNAGPLEAFAVVGHPAGILDGLLGRGHPEQDEGIDLPLFLGFHVGVGPEIALTLAERHFARIGRGQSLGIEPRDGTGAGLPCQNATPTGFNPITQRCHQPKARHDNTAHILPSPVRFFGT